MVTEELSIKHMTALAKGTVLSSGKNVKQKAGLNRSFLDTAPGSFLDVLSTKAVQAGCEVIVLNSKSIGRHKRALIVGLSAKEPI
jgi:putative transposase